MIVAFPGLFSYPIFALHCGTDNLFIEAVNYSQLICRLHLILFCMPKVPISRLALC